MSKEPSWPPAWPPCLASLSPGQPCVGLRHLIELRIYGVSTRVPWLISLSTFPNQETSPDLDDRSSMEIRKTIDLGVSQHQYLVMRDMRYECSSSCCVISRAIVTATDTSTISVRDLDFGKRDQSVGSQHIETGSPYQSCSVGVVHKADRRRQTQ